MWLIFVFHSGLWHISRYLFPETRRPGKTVRFAHSPIEGMTHETPRSKIQAPNNFKTQSHKSQNREQLSQVLKFSPFDDLVLVWSLALGIWSFSRHTCERYVARLDAKAALIGFLVKSMRN